MATMKGKHVELELTGAYWVPTYEKSLVSLKRLVDKGASFNFKDRPFIQLDDVTRVPFTVTDDLFHFHALCSFVPNPLSVCLGPKAIESLPGTDTRWVGQKGGNPGAAAGGNPEP